MLGTDPTRLEGVLARLPEAATDASAWPDLLQDFAEAAGAAGAGLLSEKLTGGKVPISRGAGELFDSFFRKGFETRDPRRRAIPGMMRGRLGLDEDLFEPGFHEREPLFTDVLTPLGFRWWAGVGFTVGGTLWCVALQRTIGEGIFEPSEQRMLAGSIPMLTQFGALADAIDRTQISAMSDALDIVRRPAILVDGLGRALRANRSCEAIFDAWFRVRGGKIVVADPRAVPELGTLLDQIRSSSGWIAFGGRKFVIARGRRRPLVVEPVNVSGAGSGPFSGGRVLLLVSDLEQGRKAPAVEILRRLFGLTPAEARLAALLGQETSLAEAAEALQITMLTARSHLKRIFEKTSVTRQADLLALLRRLPGD